MLFGAKRVKMIRQSFSSTEARLECGDDVEGVGGVAVGVLLRIG
jgi:hypothetical protein